MTRLALACGAIAIAIAAIVLAIAARPSAPEPARLRDASVRAPSAPPSAPVSVREPRTADAAPPAIAELVALREGGAASEPWVPQATALFAAIAEARDAGCFVAGCGAELVFASEAELARRRGEIEASADFRRWTGGTRWAASHALPDGRVATALILYRPD